GIGDLLNPYPTGALSNRVGRGPPLVGRSRLVPGLHVLDPAEGQQRRRATVVGLVRRQQKAGVIAQRAALDHLTREPASTVVEDRKPPGAFVPSTAAELVKLVARVAAEQPGEGLGLGGQHVNRQYVGSLG